MMIVVMTLWMAQFGYQKEQKMDFHIKVQLVSKNQHISYLGMKYLMTVNMSLLV